MNGRMEQVKGYQDEFKKWSEADPGLISGVSDMIMAPVVFTAGKLTPAYVAGKVGDAIQMAISQIMWGSETLYNKDNIVAEVKKYNPEINSLEDIRKSGDLNAMNRAAASFVDWNVAYAGSQGGATGAFGLLGLPANIPALFTCVFRMMQQVACCYGFDPSRPEEKDFMLRILALTTTARKADKQAALEDVEVRSLYLQSQLSKTAVNVALKQTQITLLKQTWKSMSDKSALIILRNLLKSIGVNLTKKKALQMIPAVSAVVGLAFDACYARDVGKVANMLYRKRRYDEAFNVVPVEYVDVVGDVEEIVPGEEVPNPFKEETVDAINPFRNASFDEMSPKTEMIVKLLVKIAKADGKLDDAELDQIKQNVTELGEKIEEGQLDEIVDEVDDMTVADIFSGHPELDHDDLKEQILLMAMTMSLADENIDPTERKIVQEIVDVLKIDDSKFDEIYRETMELKKRINTEE